MARKQPKKKPIRRRAIRKKPSPTGSLKNLSSPQSTGSAGALFEAHVQAAFVTLMLTGGYAPALPCWPITELKLQGKVAGYNIDDAIVTVTKEGTTDQARLLCQIKSDIAFTIANQSLADVFNAAWADFNNPTLFRKGIDKIALITGPLSESDFDNVSWILELAHKIPSHSEYFARVTLANYSPSRASEKLNVIRQHLRNASQNSSLSDEVVFEFMQNFYLIGYDLGLEYGGTLSLLHSHMSQFDIELPEWAWGRIVNFVQTWNRAAGIITRHNLPVDLVTKFSARKVSSIPSGFAKPSPNVPGIAIQGISADTLLAPALLVGDWDESNSDDKEILKGFVHGF